MAAATPPRMLVLVAGPAEALVALPMSYEKALDLAADKFSVPKTHVVRLTCKAAEMPWIGGYAGGEEIYIADNDSYHYACAGKHVVRLNVHVFDKNPPGTAAAPAAPKPATPAPTPTPAAAPAPPPAADKPVSAANGDGKKKGGSGKGAGGGGGGGGGSGNGGEAAAGKAGKGDGDGVGEGGGGGKSTINSAAQEVICQTVGGKEFKLAASISGDLPKGPPPGDYLGTMSIQPNTFQQKFIGRQLGPNEVVSKYVIHDKSTAKLLFRPRSIRPKIDILFPEEKSLEVSLSVLDWTVTAAYPMTSLIADGGRQKLRWFLRVKAGGVVEDLLTGTEASGLFVELLPSPKPRPSEPPSPSAPLIPAWPDVRPSNAWCLPQTIFVPHIDRILTVLGLPAESRTSLITSWLPGITRHKNIAYRILNQEQLNPSTALSIIPPPQALLRVFILFRGIPDSEMKDWENAGLLHAEMGLDWRSAVGWSEAMNNEEMFRVVEYGAMEVFD